MYAPNPKRSRKDVSSSVQNPNSLPNFNQNHLLSIISPLLLIPEPLLTSSISPSIDGVFDKALVFASDDVSVQNQLLERAREVLLVLLESTKRLSRNRKSATEHNSNSWPLPPELTIKVFSLLDTKSLMQAMTCCTMFQQCAMDSSSYSHINLTTSAKNVNNEHVLTMISRAGKELRFLELGHTVPLPDCDKPLLTRDCLTPLSSNHGFIGYDHLLTARSKSLSLSKRYLKCLRTLHLYDVREMQGNTAISALSACSNLTDLKIVGKYGPCTQLLKSLTTKCRFIEKLFFEIYDFPKTRRKESPALEKFLTNIIPNLTSLSLIRFRLKDETVQTLLESARKLKHLDLSRNTTIKGRFLSDSGSSFHDGPLGTLILRDCSSLEEKEVSEFLKSISTGDLRFIRHIDISNNLGIISDGVQRTVTPNFPLEKLKKRRPDIKFVAVYPPPRPTMICGVKLDRKSKKLDSEAESSSSDDE